MKFLIKKILLLIPWVKKKYKHYTLYNANMAFAPGHFYSTIVSITDIKKRAKSIWPEMLPVSIDGINLNTKEQIRIVSSLSRFYDENPFIKEQPIDDLRYNIDNGFFSYSDGIILHAFIRYLKPKNILEVGSGFSSALMLDTNDVFFKSEIQLTFVEPYPDRLNKLLKQEEDKNVRILKRKVQDVDITHFNELNANDILFIDSTHVSKCGSDLNHIVFNILPVLNDEVYVHFHDIFYPFEYPKEWVYNGYNWNENYFIKAFLMYNTDYEIVCFSDYLHKQHPEVFKNMPLAYRNTGGNLWLKKRSKNLINDTLIKLI